MKAVPGQFSAKLSGVVSLAPFLTAALLTSAAILKVHYLRNYPISEDGFFHSRNFTICLLETELLLSALLMYPRTRRMGAAIAAILLSAFIAYSVNLWSQGIELCGCLGVLSTRPEIMAGTDLAFLLTLLEWLSRNNVWKHPVRKGKFPVRLAAGGAILLAIAAPLLARQTNGRATGFSQLRLDANPLDLGTLDYRQAAVSKTIGLTNDGTEDVVIDKISTSCRCTTTSLESAHVPPGQTVPLTVNVNWSDRIGKQVASVEIQTHRGATSDLMLAQITGIISAPVRLSAEELDFGIVSKSTQNICVLRIGSDPSRGPITLSSVSFYPEPSPFRVMQFTTDGNEVHGPPCTGRMIEISIACQPTTNDISSLRSRLDVSFLGDQPRRWIGLSASLRPDEFVVPSEIVLQPGDAQARLNVYAPSGITSVEEVVPRGQSRMLNIISSRIDPRQPGWWIIDYTASPQAITVARRVFVTTGAGHVLHDVTVLKSGNNN